MQKGLDAKPKDDLVRVITFAQAAARRPLADDAKKAPARSPRAPRDRRRSVRRLGSRAATDIASAMQLAYGLYPAGYLRRAVILSDGVQTDGDMLAEANRARQVRREALRGPLQAPRPRGGRGPRLRALRTRSTSASRSSSTPDLLEPPADGEARAQAGEAINGLDGVRTVDLKAGTTTSPSRASCASPGEVTYALELTDIPEDRFKENNRYAVTGRPGPARRCSTSRGTRRTRATSRARSRRSSSNVDTRGPRAAVEPARARALRLRHPLGRAGRAVSLTQQDAIEQYVRDLGGGFLFAGGENGYGLGGWYHTTVERILPVRMDAEKRRDEPDVAMALVIDRSGSMTGLPLEMAKQAAKATADTLAADDLLEVIAFDSQPTRIVRMTAAKHRARIQSDIARIQPGGGTEIFSALDAAYQALTSRARGRSTSSC
jgi:Ca-activated chloride channel family protein